MSEQNRRWETCVSTIFQNGCQTKGKISNILVLETMETLHAHAVWVTELHLNKNYCIELVVQNIAWEKRPLWKTKYKKRSVVMGYEYHARRSPQNIFRYWYECIKLTQSSLFPMSKALCCQLYWFINSPTHVINTKGNNKKHLKSNTYFALSNGRIPTIQLLLPVNSRVFWLSAAEASHS
jgi:hypothetical protein